jgi:hypothetical protein
MTEAQLWALLTFAALGGWAATLVLFARATLPMANALKVTEQVDDRIDRRIASVLAKADDIRERRMKIPGLPEQKPSERPKQPSPIDQMREIFGGTPIEPFNEQPDAEGLEVIGT